MQNVKSYFFLLLLIWLPFIFIWAQANPLIYTTGEDLAKKTAQNLYIKVSVDKKTAYEGECIVAKYHLYVAVDIEGKLSKAPSFTGFASYDLETGNVDQYEVQLINGIPFKIYLIKSVQLFGLRPGMQRLEPIELDATIRYKRKSITTDAFGFAKSADTLLHYAVKSTPVEIMIKELPKNNQNTITGGVGQFELLAEVANGSIAKGQADTIHFSLSGTGNWHEAVLPDITWPENIEVYEPRINENINTSKTPLAGTKMLSYPIVSYQPGTLKIPPVSFTYFDPAKKNYQTRTTDTLFIQVKDESYTVPRGENTVAKKDFTKIFTGIAVALFPLTAIVLIALLFFRKKKKTDHQDHL
jgi:hypothetical protein